MSASRGWRAALGCGLLLLDLVAIVVVVMAVSSARLTAPAESASASKQKAEAGFLAQLHAANVPISTQTAVQADALCIIVEAGGTSNAVAAEMVQHLAGLSHGQASTFVEVARSTVCGVSHSG